MKHIYRRCKHCNKEYVYCTYGNGPDWGTEEHCSMDYCGECQKAINYVLSKIPKKISYKMELIPNYEFHKINHIITEQKNAYDENIKNKPFAMTEMIGDMGYEKIDGCYIGHVLYIRGTKENGDIEIKQSMEYDLINKKLTGNKYKFFDNPHTQYKKMNQMKFKLCTPSSEKELNPPQGKNFFTDFYDIITKNENGENN